MKTAKTPAQQIAELQEEIVDLEESIEKLEKEVDAGADDAGTVEALRFWFKRRGVAYRSMDADTAWLWKTLNGI